MNNGRRTFLSLAVGGLGTLAGLFGSGRVSAGHPRLFGFRRSCQPCYPAVESTPLSLGQKPEITAVPAIEFCFPNPLCPTVKGSGALFVWGYVNYDLVSTTNKALSPVLNGTSQPYKMTALNTADCPAPMPYMPLGGNKQIFAYRCDTFDTTAASLTVAISYANTLGNMVTISSSPFTCGY
jgi:hypothetical protein